MTKQDGNIIIKRVKKKPAGTNKNVKSTSKKQKFESQYHRQIKILAVLLILISFLTLLALVSYSTRDEANTQISWQKYKLHTIGWDLSEPLFPIFYITRQ